MGYLNNKKQVNGITILFMVTYMVSYITRINYATIISEIESSTRIPRDLLSIALTSSFITYGVGQIISGFLGDYFSPKKLVSVGLVLSSFVNLCVPLYFNPLVMTVLWSVNGFAQSLMWPPLVKLMTALLSDEDYNNASVKVSWGSSLGTILVYLVSPLLISVFGWESVFYISTGIGMVMLCFWNKYCINVDVQRKKTDNKSGSKRISSVFTPVMIAIMIAIILQGMLRDGVTTWMPTYISETYNLSSVIAILTGVILPVFAILSFKLASVLYTQKVRNPVMCACIFFALGTVSSICMFCIKGHSAVLSVLFAAILTGCMHGVNLVLICMVPMYFKKQGNVSMVSGIINSCTYIGSALSTYGIAFLSENKGWNFTLFIWILICLVGTLVCILNSKPWKKKYQIV